MKTSSFKQSKNKYIIPLLVDHKKYNPEKKLNFPNS